MTARQPPMAERAGNRAPDSTLDPDAALNDGVGPRWSYRPRGHAVAEAFRQFTRHRLRTLGTLVVLGVALALPALLLFVAPSLSALSARTLEGESLTLYLDTTLSTLRAAELATELEARSDVRATRYLSPQDALLSFDDDEVFAAAIDALGSNPLPGAIIVYPETDSLTDVSIDTLGEALALLEPVVEVHYDLEWVRRLQASLALVRAIGGLLAAFLLVTALVVLVSTIHLELLRRRHEHTVARLLGASRWFSARPLVYGGALYGLLAGTLGGLLACLSLLFLQTPLQQLASAYDRTVPPLWPSMALFGTFILISIVLGVLAALLALYQPSRQLFR